MKKYIIQKTIEAEPMFKYEAEARLGHELSGKVKDAMGYLVCDMNGLKWDWVSEEKFSGVPCNTPQEQLMLFLKQLRQWISFFEKYTKIKINVDRQERLWVYNAIKHLKLLNTTLMKLLNKNWFIRHFE